MQTGAIPPPEWIDEFVLARASNEVGARSRLFRQVRLGELIPVARGVYRRCEAVSGTEDDRYLARVHGAQLATSDRLVFSHHSAAALWALPSVAGWPGNVHVLGAVESGGRSTAALSRHGVGIPGEICELGGLSATSLGRTLADVGSIASLSEAVAMADAALAGMQDFAGQLVRPQLDRSILSAEIALRGAARGIRQLRWVEDFADGDSDSAGESVSRVGMHLIGCPPPILQQVFFDAAGRIGFADFWWPEFNLIGEFDGRGKYLRPEFTHGEDTGRIVMREKVREDRLRATETRPSVVRWDWETARSLRLLRNKLRGAGLPV